MLGDNEIKDDLMDTIYRFAGEWDIPSCCGLKIIKQGPRNIIITTDLNETNAGSSVTEITAELALLICCDYKLSPESIIFISRNPERKSKLDFYAESFFLANLQWNGKSFSSPAWKKISRDEIRKLTGI
ncbi:MAG: hypothetical protein A2096_05285 [Spirochaetes bacterium GWF1_41_5]|nr:MAG: hypothetical protein A2096_05285 [Spirochaetes bacterium GWF1_41_5]HBE01707.1 hypothetical protein [Spirochaetia bacterium]